LDLCHCDSPDGQTLQAAVRIRQSSCGTCVLESHSKPFLVMQIQLIAFRPDGQTLSSSSDKTIKLWNLRNGEVLQTLSGHLDWVFFLLRSA